MSSIGPVTSGVPYVTPKPAPAPAPKTQQPVAPATDADGDHDGSTAVNDKV